MGEAPAERRHRHRIGLSVAVATIALFTGAATPGPPASPSSADAASEVRDAPFQDGVVLLGFEQWVSPQHRRAAIATVGAKDTRTIGAGVHVLVVPRGKVLPTVRLLRTQPGVRYAEPDYLEQESA